ncbi:MAG: hypothetical protein AAFX09_08220 [Pseudomonadota bacterium]
MEDATFRLPPRDYVLSTTNIVRMSRLYYLLAKTGEKEGYEFGRREFPNWMTDQLTSVDGNIENDRRKIVWDNLSPQSDFMGEGSKTMTVDRAFNDDPSFRWVTDFANIAVTPPTRNHLHRIQWRVELITAAFLISGLYTPRIEGWKNPFQG